MAHGGRGSSSYDHHYSDGSSRGGNSRRSAYRGMFLRILYHSISMLGFIPCIQNLMMTFDIPFSVLVTGLPYSASWQDLKVIISSCTLCFG